MSQLCSRVLDDVHRRIVGNLQALPRMSAGVLLDVGCWDGVATLRYARALGGARMLGVEVFEQQARAAEQRGIEVARIDLERGTLPWPDTSVDVVVCNQVLEHLKNIWQPLSEIHRVLKPAGFAVVSVPNLASFHNRVLLAIGRQPTSIRSFGPHVRGYTFHEFRKVLTHRGAFRVLRTEGSGFPPLAPPWSAPLSFMFRDAAHTCIVVAQRGNAAASWRSWLAAQATDGMQTYYAD
jgi:methionine biosynthesis protein MetW